MADWRDELKDHLDAYFEKRIKVGKEIHECIASLSAYNIKGVVESSARDPWLWEINLRTSSPQVNISFTISLEEIEYFLGETTGYGEPVRKFPEDLKSVVTGLILQKVKEEVPLD
ncbi:hypothetical protein H7B90_00780 [Cohnella xylanilytica]|uniref:Uncharacterized protein n=1 Tax=Cohnella xylanilytica TaxID=557555 RepID=A0A841TNM3_9BACL|nr:hypothetical protein [Cohnella xylanilytica]MBB6689926.1 hypothetical protein [Cohnella xylanilytica]